MLYVQEQRQQWSTNETSQKDMRLLKCLLLIKFWLSTIRSHYHCQFLFLSHIEVHDPTVGKIVLYIPTTHFPFSTQISLMFSALLFILSNSTFCYVDETGGSRGELAHIMTTSLPLSQATHYWFLFIFVNQSPVSRSSQSVC